MSSVFGGRAHRLRKLDIDKEKSQLLTRYRREINLVPPHKVEELINLIFRMNQLPAEYYKRKEIGRFIQMYQQKN